MASKKRKAKGKRASAGYTAVPGSPFTDADAKKLAPFLLKLTKKHGGKLTAKVVLEEAKKPRSPLHKHFEWDNKAAAAKYRVTQARAVIKFIRYTVSTSDEEVNIGMFHRINNGDELPDAEPGPGYVTLPVIVEHKTFTDGVLVRALDDLKMFRARYEMYRHALGALAPVFEAIGKIEKAVTKKMRATKKKTAKKPTKRKATKKKSAKKKPTKRKTRKKKKKK